MWTIGLSLLAFSVALNNPKVFGPLEKVVRQAVENERIVLKSYRALSIVTIALGFVLLLNE